MNIGWTTLATLEEAQKMAAELVSAHLAACVQISGPISSYFLWHGSLDIAEEYRLTIKFLAAQTGKLEAWLQENHPSEIPQWLAVSADRVGASYERWAADEAMVQLPDKNAPSVRQEVVKLSKQGRNLLRKKRFEEAKEVFLEAMKLDEENPYILVGLADTCRELKKFDQAISYYEKVIKFDAVNIFALRGIGDAYRGLLLYKNAILYWLRYMECNKRDIYVMVRLAESFNKIDDFAKAESFYLMALGVNGEDKYALLGLGSLYYKAENDDKAAEYFNKLLSLDDSYVAVLTMVGNICRRRCNYEVASQYYEKAVNLEPWNSFAIYGLGDCHRGMADWEQAIQCWEKILQNEPDNQELLTRIGDAMLNLNRLDKALEYYTRSEKLGFNMYTLLGMSKLYHRKGNFSEAEKCCREILKKVPNHPRAMAALASIVHELGDTDKIAEIKAKIAACEQR